MKMHLLAVYILIITNLCNAMENNQDENKPIIAKTGNIASLMFVPHHNDRFATYTGNAGDTKIQLWSAKDGENIQAIDTELPVLGFALSNNGLLAASIYVPGGTSTPSIIQLWDIEDNKSVQRILVNDMVTSVHFDSADEQLFIGSKQSGTQLYNIKTGKYIKTISEDWFWRIHYINSYYVGLGYYAFPQKQNIIFFNFKTKKTKTLSGINKNPLISVQWSPDSKLLATAPHDSRDQTPHIITIWDVATTQPIQALNNGMDKNNEIFSSAFTPESNDLLTGDATEQITIWDIKCGKQLKKIKSPANANQIITNPEYFVAQLTNETAAIWDSYQFKIE